MRFWSYEKNWLSGIQRVMFVLVDEKMNPTRAYENLYQARKRLHDSYRLNFLRSLSALLFFLGLIWLINRKPL